MLEFLRCFLLQQEFLVEASASTISVTSSTAGRQQQ
jgi:hypothetical protein